MSSRSSACLVSAGIPAHPLRSSVYVVNMLDGGLPTPEECKERLDADIRHLQSAKVPVLKLIHGYGTDTNIRAMVLAIRNYLRIRKMHGDIKTFVPGESWSAADVRTLELIRRVPESIMDNDFGRENRGITLVLL
jgi:hypothetical protein